MLNGTVTFENFHLVDLMKILESQFYSLFLCYTEWRADVSRIFNLYQATKQHTIRAKDEKFTHVSCGVSLVWFCVCVCVCVSVCVRVCACKY